MPANGQMLRLARQLRGFQQVDAARGLGIEQPMLSRLENGLVEIRDDFVERAARAYELPESFFSQADTIYGPPVSIHAMWRKKASVAARELDKVVAELNIRVMHLRRLLESAEVSNPLTLPKLDIDEYGDPARIAAIVRAHWKIPRGPLRDLTVLVERAGVVVVHTPLVGGTISGVTFAIPGLPPLVALSSEQPADRMRFTLAHELGHLIMHRFPTANMEREANDFAVALLMPDDDIREYFTARRVDLALLASLKPEWRVSMASLLMTAKRLGVVGERQYEYLWKQMSIRKFRLREPPELDFPHEKPTVLANLIKVHLTTLQYSVDELSKTFHVRPAEFERLYARPEDVTPGKPRLRVVR